MKPIEGTFKGGEPYLRVGTGRPLVYLSGFSVEHANPTGYGRWLSLLTVRPFARAGFDVYFTGRTPNLPPTTFADLAASQADGLENHFKEPVDILGHSTGGSLVLQIIADRAEVVRRAVVASAAYKLGPTAKRVQLDLLRSLESDGRFRADNFAAALTHNRVMLRLLSIPMRLVSLVKVPNPADPIAVLRAEDQFDVYDRLPWIRTDTLVIGGARDYFYSSEMFAETARLMPNGEAIVYPKRGHNIVTSKQFVSDVVSFLQRPEIT
jgi:pimeloyl-ACP methyl ester carboxylesterase